MIIKKGYAAIGMLITIVIIAILSLIMMSSLKNISGESGVFKSPTDIKSAESQANEKIKEIEAIREQARNSIGNQDY